MKKFILVLGLLSVAMSAFAQRGGMMQMGGGAMNPTMILAREDVQEDLKLTDEQKDKLTALTNPQNFFPKMQAAMQAAGLTFEDMRTEEGRKKAAPLMEKMQADAKKEIEAVLTPEQNKRWNEIFIQLSGNRAVLVKEVAKAVEITTEQDAKIKDLQAKQAAAGRGLFQQVQNQEISMEEMREKSAKNNEIFDAEIGKILTEAQKTKLKEMGGKPFVKKDDQ
ncbi:MAG TPA: hypothetical protein VK171_13680 [Fimbriimonas sp.]|nr:hypothetical protein [Fimbriimonas sp.]